MSNLYKQIQESLIFTDVSTNFKHKPIVNNGKDIYKSAVKQLLNNDINLKDTEYYYNLLVESGQYTVNDYAELKDIISVCLLITSEPNLNWIDVHKITSMRYLFSPYYDSDMKFNYEPDKNFQKFNGDISKWNTEHVTDMAYMFKGCKSFDKPLYFNTKNVKDMSYMFYGCESFDQKLNFDTSSLENNKDIFRKCIISEKNKFKIKV